MYSSVGLPSVSGSIGIRSAQAHAARRGADAARGAALLGAARPGEAPRPARRGRRGPAAHRRGRPLTRCNLQEDLARAKNAAQSIKRFLILGIIICNNK